MNIVAAFQLDAKPVANGQPSSAIEVALAIVRVRARRLSLWMEQVWGAGRSSPDQGLAITAGEVAWLLAGDEVDREAAAFYAADARALALQREGDQAQAALARDPAWAALVSKFALDRDEADMLALLVAAEADPGLQRVIAYLHDDTRLNLPSPALSARLAGMSCRLWSGHNLVRWRLAASVDDALATGLTTAWRIDPAVMFALRDGVWHDPKIADVVRTINERDLPAVTLHRPALAALGGVDDLTQVELTGPAGIGRQTLAARFAATRGQSLLVADFPTLLAQGMDAREAILRVLRHAAYDGALAYFRDADAIPATEWMLARPLGIEFLRATRVAMASEVPIALAPLALDERVVLWRSLSAAQPPEVLRTHRLTPAEIDRLARADGDTRTIKRGAQRPDNNLLALLPCPYDWDDLILPSDIARQLREFADQVRLRWSVYDEWGFGPLAHMGFGIAALFGGPSGTGKTMAAQVIAKSLGLDLYRVDLAGVVNKYVGETEKRLREVFDACEHSGALLFFDEADALFGGRMQVKDAHDRFANIETNYLLQRIETFDGVTILATNRRNEIDEAFVRRLRFIVDFLPPQPAERLILWQRALRPTSPAGEVLLDEIDWALLADRLNITGAAIKNIVLAAAFLAKAQGERIGMPHILHAARRELAKQNEKLPVSMRDRSGA